MSVYNASFHFPLLFLLYINSTLNAAFDTSLFSLEDPFIYIQPVNKSFVGNHIFKEYTIPFHSTNQITGLGVFGFIQLLHKTGLVRIVLTDELDNDYLVSELWYLVQETDTLSLQNYCHETKKLPAVTPKHLKVHIRNATVSIDSISYCYSQNSSLETDLSNIQLLRKKQTEFLITCINKQITKHNLSWSAGVTDLALTTYEQKKCIFGKKASFLQPLQGLEYYRNGIFTILSDQNQTVHLSDRTSAVVDSFDWRVRHNAHVAESPYYDRDTLGSGWATPVRNQSDPQFCGSCWSHSSIATAEIMTNLYYNCHVDLDLSEHYLMTCSCAEACFTENKPCSGGKSTKSAEWIVKYGVTDEENFPYKASDSLSCKDSGSTPQEHLYFTKGIFTDTVPSEDSLKQFLIHYGPLNVFINTMWHCMCLVGFTKDTETDETVWIFKNSFGLSSGNNGYMHSKVSITEMKTVDALIPPVISKNYTDADILCVDYDKDGYYNWGIGPKPKTCPQNCPDEADCDDSSADFGPMEENGSCKKINSPILNSINNRLPMSIIYNNSIQPKGIQLILRMQKKVSAYSFVFDSKGKLIARPLCKQSKDFSIICHWNGTDLMNTSTAPGIYIIKIIFTLDSIDRVLYKKVFLPY